MLKYIFSLGDPGYANILTYIQINDVPDRNKSKHFYRSYTQYFTINFLRTPSYIIVHDTVDYIIIVPICTRVCIINQTSHHETPILTRHDTTRHDTTVMVLYDALQSQQKQLVVCLQQQILTKQKEQYHVTTPSTSISIETTITTKSK